MVTIHPRLILVMGAIALTVFFLACRFDPRKPHAKVFSRAAAGLFLLLAWNLLPLPRLGVNPLSVGLAGWLGLPGVGLLALLR